VRPNARTDIRQLHSVEFTDGHMAIRDLLAVDATVASFIAAEMRLVI
jgi:hypothetical protein